MKRRFRLCGHSAHTARLRAIACALIHCGSISSIVVVFRIVLPRVQCVVCRVSCVVFELRGYPVPQSKIRSSPLAVVNSTQEVLPPK